MTDGNHDRWKTRHTVWIPGQMKIMTDGNITDGKHDRWKS